MTMRPNHIADGYCDIESIREVIGEEPTTALQNAFGGKRVYIPIDREQESRDREFASEAHYRLPIREIAKRCGVSARTIYRWLAESRNDP